MLKVAILLLNQGRGSGEVARAHARNLLKTGNKVYFMHPKNKGVEGAENIDIQLHTDIMPVHEYLPAAKVGQKPVSRMGYEEAMAYLPTYEQALEAIIGEVDIIIGHHANLSAIATANVARKHQKPYILFLHGTGIEPRHEGHYDDQLWALIHQAILDANGVLVTTEYVRDALILPQVELPLDKFLILPCGVNLQELHPENVGDIKEKYNLPEKYVICPGALMAVKGPQNVVEASKEYADLAPTIFIGDGEMREELEAALGDRGRFLGYVSAEDKAQLINAATVLTAAPEKKEHFGIIYAEALAAGTVPVAYEGGGVGSVISEETGILTERNAQSLGKAVRSILLDDEKAADMRQKGRLRAEEGFSNVLLVKELEEWMQSILDAEKVEAE